jgi:hypothetical protein
MKRIYLTFILGFSLLCIASQTFGQGAVTNRELRKLITEFHSAERLGHTDKMMALLDDSFKETTSSGSGIETSSKVQKGTAYAADDAEIWRNVRRKIVTNNEISPLLVEAGRNTAKLRYKLTVRQQLQLPDTTEKFKNTERFIVNGTAVRKNGKWQLTTLHKEVPRASLYKNWRDEITENINFGMAVISLLLEEKDKTRNKTH